MILYLILVIVGGLLLFCAVRSLIGRLAFVKGGERAVGTVVQLVEKKDDEGTCYFYPVFDIHTRQQKTITYRHGTGSSPAAWQVGETAAFIFEPGKPYTVRFVNFWGLFWWPLSLMALAVDLLMIGGGYFLLYRYFGA
ncbi:DUF3592 domain-containing protein [Chitinophaga sp. HK235]|uniref:DUF3592 domain-containing protein n=1 Tax=Chitinophaga sp. HK235 TaxID=2952571 RepID=UPI001BA5D622